MKRSGCKLKWRQWLLVLLPLFVSVVYAQEPNRGAEIRAAFIYNFAKFVEWPARSFRSANSPLRLCALANSDKAARLDMINGREAQGHPILLQWLKPDAPITRQALGACQMLYLSIADMSTHPALLGHIGQQPVLTIGESENFISQGGMVALFVDKDHVRFSINLSAANASELEISARLLQLARNVR